MFKQTRGQGAQWTALQRRVTPGMLNATKCVLLSIKALRAAGLVKE